ncbi:MAG: anti-sigma regulatory factor [Actinobacteria bacterium]|nr:MAG: anti-sigma regulatory factor [Actinomycetota bacterium]
MAEQDEVRLTVPAMPEFLRLARVTATGLASRLGFTFDEVEDLRLAIDELCFALMGTRGRPGTIRLRYLVTEQALEVEGVGDFRGEGPEPTLSDLSSQILTALVDEHDVRRGSDGLPCFRFRKARMEYGRR